MMNLFEVRLRGKNPKSHLNKASKYSIYVDSMMNKYLSKNFGLKKRKRIVSIRTLAIHIGLVNENIIVLTREARLSHDWIQENLCCCINYQLLKYFTNEVNQFIYKQIMRSLKKFQYIGAIEYKKVVRFVETNRRPTKAEEKIILDIEERVLNELGFIKADVTYGHNRLIYQQLCQKNSLEILGMKYVRKIQIDFVDEEKLSVLPISEDNIDHIYGAFKKKLYSHCKRKNSYYEEFIQASIDGEFNINELGEWTNCFLDNSVLTQIEYMIALLSNKHAPIINKSQIVHKEFDRHVRLEIQRNESDIDFETLFFGHNGIFYIY